MSQALNTRVSHPPLKRKLNRKELYHQFWNNNRTSYADDVEVALRPIATEALSSILDFELLHFFL